MELPETAKWRPCAPMLSHSAMEKRGHLSPLAVYKELNNRFGRGWWEWEPETLWHSLGSPSGELKGIVMALQTATRTNFPFELWHVFEKCGQAFNLNPVDFQIVQPLELNEASLTIFILKSIRPEENFEADILGYLAALAHEAGVTYLPPELFGADAQPYLTRLVDDSSGVGKDTQAAWPRTGTADDYPALRIQLARLQEIKDYVKSRL